MEPPTKKKNTKKKTSKQCAAELKTLGNELLSPASNINNLHSSSTSFVSAEPENLQIPEAILYTTLTPLVLAADESLDSANHEQYSIFRNEISLDTPQVESVHSTTQDVFSLDVAGEAEDKDTLLEPMTPALPPDSITVRVSLLPLEGTHHHFGVMRKQNAIAIMISLSVTHTPVTFVNLFPGLLKFGDFRIAQLFYGFLPKIGDEYVNDVFVVSSVILMFADLGCMNYARKVFDQCLNKNNDNWNTMIAAYVQHNLPLEAIDVFVQALDSEEDGLCDDVTFLSVADHNPLCRHHAKGHFWGFTIHGSIQHCFSRAWLRRVIRVSLFEGNTILPVIAKERKFGAYVFVAIPPKPPDEIVIQTLSLFLSCFSKQFVHHCLEKEEKEHSISLKPRFDTLNDLVNVILDVTKCVIEFNELPVQYNSHKVPAYNTAFKHILVAAYWCIRSIVVYVAQITSLTTLGYEIFTFSDAWEISTLAFKLEGIVDHLKNQLGICHKHIGDITDAEAYRMLRELFSRPHTDNMKIIKALIYSHEDNFSLYDDVSKKRGSLEALRRKNVFLLFSGLEFSTEELLFSTLNIMSIPVF